MAGDAQLTKAELPDWRTHPATRADDVRLATTLHFAGEDSLAMQTFSHLGKTMPAGALAPLTQLVLDLGQPHYAVRIAKKAAGRGVLIYPAYYPLHEVASYATKVEPALALSIARQETELNPRAVSRAGARGLMQLMPATAQKVAGWIGERYDGNRLLSDWRYNVRLGETYLARRMAQYGGSYVMAAAAYNAGAGRVDQWVAEFGDPRLPGVDVDRLDREHPLRGDAQLRPARDGGALRLPHAPVGPCGTDDDRAGPRPRQALSVTQRHAPGARTRHHQAPTPIDRMAGYLDPPLPPGRTLEPFRQKPPAHRGAEEQQAAHRHEDDAEPEEREQHAIGQRRQQLAEIHVRAVDGRHLGPLGRGAPRDRKARRRPRRAAR